MCPNVLNLLLVTGAGESDEHMGDHVYFQGMCVNEEAMSDGNSLAEGAMNCN